METHTNQTSEDFADIIEQLIESSGRPLVEIPDLPAGTVDELAALVLAD